MTASFFWYALNDMLSLGRLLHLNIASLSCFPIRLTGTRGTGTHKSSRRSQTFSTGLCLSIGSLVGLWHHSEKCRGALKGRFRPSTGGRVYTSTLIALSAADRSTMTTSLVACHKSRPKSRGRPFTNRDGRPFTGCGPWYVRDPQCHPAIVRASRGPSCRPGLARETLGAMRLHRSKQAEIPSGHDEFSLAARGIPCLPAPLGTGV